MSIVILIYFHFFNHSQTFAIQFHSCHCWLCSLSLSLYMLKLWARQRRRRRRHLHNYHVALWAIICCLKAFPKWEERLHGPDHEPHNRWSVNRKKALKNLSSCLSVGLSVCLFMFFHFVSFCLSGMPKKCGAPLTFPNSPLRHSPLLMATLLTIYVIVIALRAHCECFIIFLFSFFFNFNFMMFRFDDELIWCKWLHLHYCSVIAMHTKWETKWGKMWTGNRTR